MYLSALKSPAYSNCRMLSPDGVLMCRMGKKRAQWYIEKGLAELIEENPYTIKLLFRPNGSGYHQDPFYLADKQNICVVCGSSEMLTKHHTIPRCFRKYFPFSIKGYSSHDLVLLCAPCHEHYETHANLLKKNLISKEITQEDIVRAKAIKSAKSLICYRNSIPDDRCLDLMIAIEDYVGDYSDEIALRLAQEKHHLSGDNNVWKRVAHSIDDISEFNIMWRKHFVEIMKPKFLPKYWDIYR